MAHNYVIRYTWYPYGRTNRSDCLRFWFDWADSWDRMETRLTQKLGSIRMIIVVPKFITERLAWIPNDHLYLLNDLYLKWLESLVA